MRGIHFVTRWSHFNPFRNATIFVKLGKVDIFTKAFLCQLPMKVRLRIELIGPDLVKSVCQKLQPHTYLSMPTNIKYQWKKNLFENTLALNRFYFVLFNCNGREHIPSSWKQVTRVLFKGYWIFHPIPFNKVFVWNYTTYCKLM